MIKQVHLPHISVIKTALFALLLTCLCTMTCVTPKAYANNDTIDKNQPSSLKIMALHNGVALQGMAFNLYHVADIGSDGTFVLNDTFKKYPVVIDTTDITKMSSLATTLKGYIARDGIAPSEEGITDTSGMIHLTKSSATQKPLSQGLYLVVGLDFNTATQVYKAEPFLVSIPHRKDVSSPWIYDVVATAKISVSEKPDENKGLTITAVKQWVENEGSVTRPSSITVDLICDGAVFDTVMLSKDNNWSAKWENLEAGHEWAVVEKEIEGYSVSVEVENFNFVVTNTEKPNTPPGIPPGDTPSKPSSAKPSLPQTGVLWWPVAVFGGIGVILLFISFIARGRKKSIRSQNSSYASGGLGSDSSVGNTMHG